MRWHIECRNCPTDDVTALRAIAAIAAAAFCPFVTSCRPSLLGLDHFSDLDLLPDLAPTTRDSDFVRWHGLRSLVDTRFLGIVLPRVLMRVPYRRHDRSRIDGFTFDEEFSASGHELLWANAAFATRRRSAARLWPLRLVRRPTRCSAGRRGRWTYRGFADILVLDRSSGRCRATVRRIRLTSAQERMLAELGLIPIGVVPYTPYLVFNTNSSLHQPTTYDRPAAARNARLSAMLQYVLCASRLAHHMKGKMRDQIGRLVDAHALEQLLTEWLSRYCLGNDEAAADIKARFPLRAAQVRVSEVPGRPGVLKLHAASAAAFPTRRRGSNLSLGYRGYDGRLLLRSCT